MQDDGCHPTSFLAGAAIAGTRLKLVFFHACFSLQYLAMLKLKLGFQAGGEVVLLALVVSCSSVWIAMYSRCHIS